MTPSERHRMPLNPFRRSLHQERTNKTSILPIVSSLGFRRSLVRRFEEKLTTFRKALEPRYDDYPLVFSTRPASSRPVPLGGQPPPKALYSCTIETRCSRCVPVSAN